MPTVPNVLIVPDVPAVPNVPFVTDVPAIPTEPNVPPVPTVPALNVKRIKCFYLINTNFYQYIS